MEVLKDGKNFRLVCDNELESIVEVLEQHLPHSIKFHQTIKTYLRDKVWQFYFYVSKEWPDILICLHFPGCTLTPNNHLYESFGIFCPQDQLEHLTLVNTEDLLIDWSKPLYINFAQSEVLEKLAVNYESCIGDVDRLTAEIFMYDSSQLIKSETFERVPDEETELRLLSADNVKDIHDLYPAGDIESIEVFEKLIKRLPGCGIFIRSTGELVAWMVQSYYGAMFSMQTKPDHRRKGYGLWLAGTLTNFVIKRGYLPFVVIRPENSASKGLYTKLGFERKFDVVRAIFKPSKQDFEA